MKLVRPQMLNDLGNMQARERSGWDRIGAIDWPIAHALALRPDSRAPIIAAANAVSRLGNGPIYFLIIAAVILFHPHEAPTILVCGGASILLLHSIYPTMKKKTARPRPMDVRADFPESLPPLDKYSFPSGHVMTLTAALTPIVLTAPRTWPLGLAAWAAMAWARLAIGHHYASDVAAGTIMGAAVSSALTYWLVS